MTSEGGTGAHGDTSAGRTLLLSSFPIAVTKAEVQ